MYIYVQEYTHTKKHLFTIEIFSEWNALCFTSFSTSQDSVYYYSTQRRFLHRQHINDYRGTIGQRQSNTYTAKPSRHFSIHFISFLMNIGKLLSDMPPEIWLLQLILKCEMKLQNKLTSSNKSILFVCDLKWTQFNWKIGKIIKGLTLNYFISYFTKRFFNSQLITRTFALLDINMYIHDWIIYVYCTAFLMVSLILSRCSICSQYYDF